MLVRVLVKGMLMICLSALAVPAIGAEKAPLDRVALQGVKVGKGVFDINLTDPLRLPLYLGVIEETLDGLQAQGVKPELVVAFRGTAVKLVSSQREGFDHEQKAALEESDELIRELAQAGVRFEACAIATRLFGVENNSVLPQVKVVGNTFNSLIGYQAKGYALIPIQ
jgi:intracellular sulfur oxidation DsrE/DsrF family protein